MVGSEFGPSVGTEEKRKWETSIVLAPEVTVRGDDERTGDRLVIRGS